MKLPCPKCGKIGPSWCSRRDCTLFPKLSIPAKQSFSGSTPNLFVGAHGYPAVNVGILASEQAGKHDNPKEWTQNKTPINEIISLRSQLVNSTKQRNINQATQIGEMNALIAQSTKPVAVDVELTKAPTFTISYPSGTTPHGPSIELKNAELTENVHVPTDVEKTIKDELKASEQISELNKKHDVYYMQKLFSAGLLGQEKRLVPTRWTITAVDDTVGKQQLEKIREFPIISEAQAYVGGHYGNQYCILFLPAKFQYELFELYVGSQDMKQTCWTDYEGFSGRTNYADDTVGGYYAARLGITKFLLNRKRQASVLAFRFVSDEYTNPLGVWVVREAVELCLQNKPLSFATNELAITFLRAYAHKKHNTNINEYIGSSKLLKAMKQRSIGDY